MSFRPTEIHRARQCMPRDKAPGLDGWNVEFYHRFWSDLSPFIHDAFANFHQNHSIPMSWSSTLLCLIPKT